MLSRKQKIEYILALEEKQRRYEQAKLRRYYSMLYDWQRNFIAATNEYHESCLCAANQIGKTRVGTNMDATHLLGEYPDDWPGYKFKRPPLCWALGYSMEKTRDLLQTELFGSFTPQDGFSGGLVPKERILSHESAGGTSNAMRTVRVKHAAGTHSTIQFWSYSQGQHAIMGDLVDWVHVDEEPKDQAIRPQLLTRTINGDEGRGGRIIYTFTPENGRTELVIQFQDTPSSQQFYMQKGWDDAPHMTEEKKERLLAQYPEYQREMRSKGEPMLGHGRIYDIGDDFILCDPVEIEQFWHVICGMDFGWDHPQAFAKLAFDIENDVVYVTNSWKAAKTSANEAWAVTKSWAANVPVAWPPDGLMHEKGRDINSQQKDHYVKAGYNLLPEHATWINGGNSVESGLYEILGKMRKGTFKIVRGQSELMEEIRQYHRNEKGKIVKVKDDILDAIRYAYMMKRCAKPFGDIGRPKIIVKPPVIGRMGVHRRGARV